LNCPFDESHINAIVYSSTRFSMMRTRTERRIKSSMTMNLMHPSSRRTKRWKSTRTTLTCRTLFEWASKSTFSVTLLSLKRCIDLSATLPSSIPFCSFHTHYFLSFSRGMLYLYCNIGHCNSFIRSQGFLYTWHWTSYHHLSCYFLSVCL